MKGLARLIKTSHPRTPWCVYYVDTERREKSGRAKRVPQWFSDRIEAVRRQQELNKNLALMGTAGQAMDATTRADYWAGRQILDAAGHRKVSFRQLADAYVAKKPSAQHARRLLAVLPEFIAAKREGGRREKTLTSLENRLKQWWNRDGLLTIDDLTRSAALKLRRQRKLVGEERSAGVETLRNDMNAASSFCSWLVNKEHPELALNPFMGLERPRQVKAPPIFQNTETERVLKEALAYARGRYLPAVVLMLANLRPSEVPHARIIYGRPPCVKLDGDAGKLRGRANRVVPLWPAAVKWLRLANSPTQGIRPLNLRGRRTICARAGVTWQQDICRHTAISNRGAILNDDARLAREAGTSEGMIFRRYHRARTPAEARGFYRLAP